MGKVKQFWVRFLVIGIGFIIGIWSLGFVVGCGQDRIRQETTEELASLTISPEVVALMTGDTQQFSIINSTTNSLSWVVVGGIGTIDATGFFTATREGIGTVEARSGSAIGKAMVTVSGAGRSYFPNKNGYSWKWSYPSGVTYILTVEGTKQIDSTSAQIGKLTYIFNGYTGTTETYWKVDNTGAYYYPMGTTSESFTVLSFPLEVGKTWTCTSPSHQYYDTTVTILATETVTVPGGTFDCYKVSYVAAGGTTYYWFGNWVGAVKALMAGSTEEVSLVWKNF